MKLKVAQKSATELFERSGNDLKIKNVNAYKTMRNLRKSSVFEDPKANWELRFASKRLLASAFEALEVYGCTKRRSGEPQEAPEEASRGSGEAPWRCLGSSWRSINLPKPRSSIHSSFPEPPRGLPEVPKSRSIDPVDVLEPPEGGQGSYTDALAGPQRSPSRHPSALSMF